jgi:hypothetical protein
VRCEALKRFSSVLAEGVPASGDGKPFPALVSRRHGRGLVLMVNGDGLWKWGFYPKVSESHDVYRNLWIRLFQWSVSFAEFNPGAEYAIRTDRGTVRAGEPVRVRVTAKLHAEAALPRVRLFQGDRFIRDLPLAEAEAGQTGQWIGLAAIETPGIYRLSVETAAGGASGAQATLQVLPPPSEGDELSADPAFLRELAALSGGRVVSPDELPDLVRSLEEPRAIERKGGVEWDPAWDSAWPAGLLAACFSLEWFWRRKRGLM